LFCGSLALSTSQHKAQALIFIIGGGVETTYTAQSEKNEMVNAQEQKDQMDES